MKFHDKVHITLPLGHIFFQMNTTHVLSFYSFKIHFKIIFPYFLGLLSGLLPSGFPTKTLYIFLFHPNRVMCPNHIILHDLNPQCLVSQKHEL